MIQAHGKAGAKKALEDDAEVSLELVGGLETSTRQGCKGGLSGMRRRTWLTWEASSGLPRAKFGREQKGTVNFGVAGTGVLDRDDKMEVPTE